MLTRLKVTGFKNLVDVDVRFGPFTCIAGPNGVGKSNLFDAIRFLSALADDKTFVDAAGLIRGEPGRVRDLGSLFHRMGDVVADTMSFEAEMIIPPTGTDNYNVTAATKVTFLRYTLELGRRHDDGELPAGVFELLHEELTYVKPREISRALRFPHTADWLRSAVHFEQRRKPYISTTGTGDRRKVLLHGDGGRQGQLIERAARQLPRTVLASAEATENPTALLARREMQSWRSLHLEPSSLRKPDGFTSPARLGGDGAHLAATLYRLARAEGGGGAGQPSRVYESVAHRLKTLFRDVAALDIDRDLKAELLTLVVTDRQGTPLPARNLSDGTLRFLALAVLEHDPEAVGVICFEEPENGIHPQRIPAMLDLLLGIAVNATMPIGADNPLRQVIVNTHSPVVVGEIAANDLLSAEVRDDIRDGRRTRKLVFQCLPETWRTAHDGTAEVIPRGALIAYLNPVPDDPPEPARNGDHARPPARPDRRVRTRLDQPRLFPVGESA